MAPKTDVKKAALKAAKGKSEQAEKKLDQSNFITSLKSSKATEEQKKLWTCTRTSQGLTL